MCFDIVFTDFLSNLIYYTSNDMNIDPYIDSVLQEKNVPIKAKIYNSLTIVRIVKFV